MISSRLAVICRITAATFVTLSVLTASGGTTGSVIKRALPAVGLVLAYDSLGNLSAQGSGFFLAAGSEFVTNYHVIEGSPRVVVRLPSGHDCPVRGFLAIDETNDLVILDVKAPAHPHLN